MASRHQDPFEGLRLDERFVRGARFLEPSAAERGRPVVPAPRGLPGMLHRLVAPPWLPRRSRRIARMVTFVAIVVGMITITVVALRQTATRGGVGTAARLGALAASPGGSPTAMSALGGGSLAEPPAGYAVTPALLAALRRGDCLTWKPYDASTASVLTPVAPVRVSCDRPHIDEVTRLVDLDPVFTRWPGASTVAQAAQDRCAGALRDFAGAIDATPHHVVGAIYPSEPSWQAGARIVACTVRTDDLRPRSGPFRIVGSIGT
ncbi:conserved hypothetical protein [Frankia canadensis]|uniref:Septum formation-related domain-containing protein n=1 Tax=Frankia canadensis TaxID=1836972 RepID=A0A2I2KJ70_9ACTN|nr:septum formation family protein [Frankia canadensis]SNQ45704.1 conserved hypothetical protein [Frankia canadensis]SOU52994.1 conserved hypothetical protein [Frankia canadensis]